MEKDNITKNYFMDIMDNLQLEDHVREKNIRKRININNYMDVICITWIFSTIDRWNIYLKYKKVSK